MDNVCHTLVGAAFGEAGLKTRTRFGNPVLMIAANLPDVDVLAFLSDTPYVALRRGITHGVVAQALLPVILTGIVLLVDRWRPPPALSLSNGPALSLPTRRAGGERARAGPLLLLSYVGVLSHVGLDWLNNYGVRLLMPFSNRWFYGDSVFIVDPWLWLALGLGMLLARRRGRPFLATASLLLAAVYICGMVVSAERSRALVLETWIREHGRPPQALMVGPAFVNPLRKTIIVDAGAYYRTGSFTWWPGRVTFDPRPVPINGDSPAARHARADPRVQAVLVWTRFPFYRLAPADGGTRVTLGDLRFAGQVGDISVVVPAAAEGNNPTGR